MIEGSNPSLATKIFNMAEWWNWKYTAVLEAAA